jgi:hypothetical protein
MRKAVRVRGDESLLLFSSTLSLPSPDGYSLAGVSTLCFFKINNL